MDIKNSGAGVIVQKLPDLGAPNFPEGARSFQTTASGGSVCALISEGCREAHRLSPPALRGPQQLPTALPDHCLPSQELGCLAMMWPLMLSAGAPPE